MSTVAVSVPALAGWVLLALLVGLALGAVAATLVARRPDRRRAAAGSPPGDAGRTVPPAPGPRSALEVDDLPAFLEHPPGSPGPAPTVPGPGTAPAPPRSVGATAVPTPRRAGAGRHSPDALSTRSTLLAMVATAAVLLLVAVVIALVSGDDAAADGRPVSSSSAPAPGEGSAREAPASGAVAARAAFGTLLLERRPVGVTVTRPGLSLRSDGGRALAHVLLPTYNCLLREPPPDPEAAGCARAATEYADLAGADLRMTRHGDRLELAGLLTTYTQPAGGPPAYTGRSYRLGVSLAAAGPERDGSTPARGLLQLGADSAPTTDEPGANVLQLPD